MKDIKVVIGSNFGDEVKGLFVNKLASDSIYIKSDGIS